MKQYLVIGAGTFGGGIAKELFKKQQDVIVSDRSEERLEEISQFATHCIVGDFKDNDVLDSLEISEFDAVFLSIGTDEYSAIIITKKLRERKAKKIIAKATSKEVGEILEVLGADRVIYAEEIAGIKVARQELMGGIIDFIEITENVSAVELEVPEQLYGRTLIDLEFSRKFGLTVSLLLRNRVPISTNIASTVFQKGDQILIVGDNKKIDNFKNKFS